MTEELELERRVVTAMVALYRSCADPRVRRQVLKLLPELAEWLPETRFEANVTRPG